MSAKSHYLSDKPIRGGVPVIFPWFGPRQDHPQSPAHGFARTLPWSVESLTQTNTSEVLVTLALHSTDTTRALWPHDFILHYHIRVGDSLDLSLEVHNTGQAPFHFEEALHTYLAVGEVRTASIQGLSNTTYLDKPDNMQRKTQDANPIRITAETDRVYLNTAATCIVDDPALRRRLTIEKQGSNATVVWNPWIAKAQAMPDFAADEWPSMLCIETCNVADNALTLAPGARHKMRAIISAETM